MLTNLIASIVVTLVTNTVTTDNAVHAPDYSFGGNVYTLEAKPAIYYSPNYTSTKVIAPATEKTDTTTVTEIRRLQFELEGKAYVIEIGQRVVSETQKTFKLKQEWKEQGGYFKDYDAKTITVKPGPVVTNKFPPISSPSN